jgi:uncharacterized protein YqeY
MTLKDKIYEDLKTAMKERDEVRTRTLRMIVSSIKYYMVDHKEISDDDVLALLSKELKTHEESLSEYKIAGRSDLIAIEEADIAIVKTYLPRPFSTDEIKSVVRDIIAETGAENMKDLGKVMAKLMPVIKGKADGKTVNTIVKDALSRDQ